MTKIISVNAGSSSLKFQLFEMPQEEVLTSGVFERIGLEEGIFTIKVNGEKKVVKEPIPRDAPPGTRSPSARCGKTGRSPSAPYNAYSLESFNSLPFINGFGRRTALRKRSGSVQGNGFWRSFSSDGNGIACKGKNELIGVFVCKIRHFLQIWNL